MKKTCAILFTRLPAVLICLLLLCGCAKTDPAEQPAQTEPPEGTGVWQEEAPTEEELLANANEGGGYVYWVAERPEIPASMNCYAFTEIPRDQVWQQIQQAVFPQAEAPVLEGSTTVYHIMASTAEEEFVVYLPEKQSAINISCPKEATTLGSSIVQTISEMTDIEYRPFEYPANDILVKYEPVCDGYCVDGGDGSTGTAIWVDDADFISISNIGTYSENVQTVDGKDLISPEAAQEILQALVSSTDSSIVVTEMEAVYYMRDGQMLPAWRCIELLYHGIAGYHTSSLIDAQTGEVLRPW